MAHQNLDRNLIRSSDINAAAEPTKKFCLADPGDISRHSNWEFDFRQIEPGPMEIEIFCLNSPRIKIIEFHMKRGVHQMGCSPPDTVTFGIPVRPPLHSWQGVIIDTPGLVNFGTGSEYDSVTGRGFAALGVSISPPVLALVSDQLGLPLPDDFERKTILPVRRRTQDLQWLSEYGHALVRDPGVPFGDKQQDDLVAGLISAACDAEEFDDRSAYTLRAKAVTRAVDLMQDRLDDGITIGQLCADSGVTWRSLTRGFKERFGIGPKQYFNRHRLGRVRSELLLESSTCSVVDAANAWGFWHMGQFSRDYRRMFGELPSETLSGAKNWS